MNVDGVSGATAGAPNAAPAAGGSSAPAAGQAFGAVLDRIEQSPLAFSGHAVKRIEQRGLQLDDDRMRRLEQAVDQAAAKGGRDSLILLDDLALVVSVQNHTVVTALDEASRKEHVFTNIDSVVIAK